ASIEEALKRGDTAARILQTATAGFRSDAVALLRETDQGEEVLDMDRLAGDEEMSPIIKLVDTVVLNALERRASDIHIETRDSDVAVKYRIHRGPSPPPAPLNKTPPPQLSQCATI